MVDNSALQIDEKAPQRTIFVRNLPYDATNKKLEDIFSEFGPIKQAFVVKDQDKHSQCRGFGYVQFVLQDDASKAFSKPLILDGRKLALDYARKKPRHEKRKRMQSEDASKLEEGEDQDEISPPSLKKVAAGKSGRAGQESLVTEQAGADLASKTDRAAPRSTKTSAASVVVAKRTPIDAKNDLQRTIVITGLTEKVRRKSIRLLCETFGYVENIVYPVPERPQVTAFVRFQDYRSTLRAVQKVNGQKVKKSNILSAVLLSKEGKVPPTKALQKCRLIVRNLSFKCDEKVLVDHFQKFGRVLGAHLPTKKVGEKEVKTGYGFVQFCAAADAQRAVESLNMTEILGRAVVVDWALPKDEYVQSKNQEKQTPGGKVNDAVGSRSDVRKSPLLEGADVDEESTDDESGDAGDSESGVEDNDENASEEDMEADEELGSGDEESHDEESIRQMEARKKTLMKDAKAGHTVFLRNLSYNTEEDEITEHFSKYGEVEDCKIVHDPETGHSKGTAFLKFKEKSAADRCLKEIDSLERKGRPLHIDGRKVSVTLAVTRGKLSEIKRKESDSKKEVDKRNLYLAYEGVITKNSPGAVGLSDADLARREKALAEKKARLKDPNYFVSRTRLCFRNLPLSVDGAELRSAVRQHCQGDVTIRSLKIMRNKERHDVSGQPRSLGYGFVEFDKHEDALRCLREMNNNPAVFGEKRRPMVEFAVESSKALKVLEERKRKAAKFSHPKDGGAGDFRYDAEKAKKIWDKKRKRIEKFQIRREERRKLKATQQDTTASGMDPDKEKGKALQGSTEILRKGHVGNNNPPSNRAKTKKSKLSTFGEKSGKKNVSLVRTDVIPKPDVTLGSASERDKPAAILEHKHRLRKGAKAREDDEKFSKLVSKYTSKLLGHGLKSAKSGSARWFET